MRFMVVRGAFKGAPDGGGHVCDSGGRWADSGHTKPYRGQVQAQFHTAAAHNMENIQEHGLRPRSGGGTYIHGVYAAHSQGKVFLSANHDAAINWHDKVENMLFHAHNDEAKHRAVMLRVRPQGGAEVDPIGDKDVPGSLQTREPVPPEHIEYHDKEHGWRPIHQWEHGRSSVPGEGDAHDPGTEADRILARRARVANWKRRSREKRAEYEASPEGRAEASFSKLHKDILDRSEPTHGWSGGGKGKTKRLIPGMPGFSEFSAAHRTADQEARRILGLPAFGPVPGSIHTHEDVGKSLGVRWSEHPVGSQAGAFPRGSRLRQMFDQNPVSDRSYQVDRDGSSHHVPVSYVLEMISRTSPEQMKKIEDKLERIHELGEDPHFFLEHLAEGLVKAHHEVSSGGQEHDMAEKG